MNNQFKIIDKQFISYYGGYGHLISNGNCKFWLWHDEAGSQKVCDTLNIIMEENEVLKSDLAEHMVDLNNCKGRCSALELENQELKQRVSELELLNDGLNYALKYIKRIDVEIDIGDDTE